MDRHTEFCKADRTTWKLTLQDINTTPKELKTERGRSRRQLFRPFKGLSVRRNERRLCRKNSRTCHEKEADHHDTTIFFTDYRDKKLKLTAHRMDSENRNTVFWNKNYRNTAPKITQYRNTANPYAPLSAVHRFNFESYRHCY